MKKVFGYGYLLSGLGFRRFWEIEIGASVFSILGLDMK